MIHATILLVTNDHTVARDLHQRLVKLGYKVVGSAASEREAIIKIRESNPDIIMTDIRLNGAGGGIKTGGLIQSTYHVPIIYITGSIGHATIQRARSTGPFGYIFEPYDDKQLLVTIETALTRHQFERKLRESRQWLDTTLTSIGDGVIATDQGGLVRFINPTAMELTEWQHTEAIGKSIQEVFLLVDEITHKQIDIAGIQKNAGRMGKTTFEGLLFSKQGRSVAVEINATLIYGDTGEVYGMVLIFRNITKQREALSEIQRQADHAEALVRVASQLNNRIELETVLNTICVITNQTLKATGTAVFLQDSRKPVFRNMAAYSDDPSLQTYQGIQFEISREIFEAMLTHENPVVVIPDIQAHPDWPYVELVEKLRMNTVVVVALFRREGLIGALISFFSQEQHIIPVDTLNLLRGLADQASSAIENAELFKQVRASRERQQFLARQLVKVQEDERRSLSRELHDEIGQMLTGLQFTLKSIMTQSTEDHRSKLDQAQILVSVIISQIRELSINLRPSLLDDLGILPTLNWHFERYEAKTGIQVIFQRQNLDQRFSPELEITVFRIVQEALTNVARYAETDAVEVNIVVLESVLKMEIRDRGKGFDLALLSKNQSMGLEGIRERAYAIGGSLEIQSEPGKGTYLYAMLPVSGQLERRDHERNHPAGR